MKRIIFLALFFAAFPLTGCYSQVQTDPASQPAEPAAPEPHTWDLGEVKKGDIVKQVFLFTNETQKQLTVLGINTSCGCTGSEIKDKILLPGQTTEVTIQFNSKGYSAGQIKQHVYINTDNTDNPVIAFTINVKVIE